MRYLPLSDSDRLRMLSAIGAGSIDDLFADVPADARLDGVIAGLPLHASEMAVERHMAALAARNLAAGAAPFFLGAGAYRHHIPASVDHLIQRGEFLTSYTPYQPEIAQGTLQMLFEFQTQVARLYGCDVANASMYDGSTACWEAVGMARRVTRRTKAVIAGSLHPHYASVARTMAQYTGDTLVEMSSEPMGQEGDAILAAIDDETSCVVVQYPDIFGQIIDLRPIADAAHAAGALLIAVVTEPVALGLIEAPGAMGADIVVGEGQAIGVGLQFGGPYLGLFACKERYVRQMPGRLCGQSEDASGRRAYVLTLSTREQHIRREKATSNICTNSGLCALAFSIHMSLLGEAGLRGLAAVNHARAVQTAKALGAVRGVTVTSKPFFNEFRVTLNKDSRQVARTLADRGILCGVPLGRLYPDRPDLSNDLLVCATETTSDADIAALCAGLAEALS
ncbi:MAG: aminomethyl-transferring glycine dehydrogenase subunit GcvPA [Sphingopyxis sp.]